MATINITASENENGISKIEIILNGNIIETIDCAGRKDEINETYTVTQNGNYTIKAYSKTSKSIVVGVSGIAMSVSYEPNGSSNWQKSYSVKLSVDDTSDDPVSSIKYKWLTDVTGIGESSFTDAESCNNEETIDKGELTGTYYLWTMLTTQSGKTNVNRSNAFYFDNEGPDITLSVEATSLTSITMKVTATDNHVGKISRIEYWLDDVKIDTKDYVDGENSLTIDTTTGENKKCKVVVYDELGSENIREDTGRTKLHSWSKYNVTTTTVKTHSKTATKTYGAWGNGAITYYENATYNESTKRWVLSDATSGNYSSLPAGVWLQSGYDIIKIIRKSRGVRLKISKFL